MKKKSTIVLLIVLISVLLTGTFLLVMLNQTKETEKKEIDLKYFSAYTECKVFEKVPAMETANGKIWEAEDYGKEHYLIGVSGSTVEEYKAYLKVLADAGFKKHSDNGEDAMEGYAFTASFTKGKLTVTVSHAIELERTYISAKEDMPLSEHLIYKEEYVKGVPTDAKTSLHMLQLKESGTSFVIQLKNGNFIVYDGGGVDNTENFLAYLDELTPGDKTPVIEAWIMSHAHNDHSGVLTNIATNKNYAKQIAVEGIYYTEPNTKVMAKLTTQSSPLNNQMIVMSANALKTQNGETTKLYRTQFGQRYYFCDMYFDVAMTIEQIPAESYMGIDFNDLSTWIMVHIEGQRILLAGDASHSGICTAMDIFDKSYFDLDVFATLHHGINVYQYFNEYCEIDTVLYTGFRTSSVWDTREDLAAKPANEQLRQQCKEYYSYGEGTVVLSFPYKVGEAKVLDGFECVYDPF